MIFVISFHRSGTQSVHHFLQLAGYQSIHNPSGRSALDFQDEWQGHEDNFDYIFANLLQHTHPTYNGISDNPMAALYEQAYRFFPQAKFILSIRDSEKWVRSIRSHIGNREFVPAEKVQYWKFLSNKPLTLQEITDAELKEIYSKHQSQARSFFTEQKAEEQLCIINLEDSDAKIANQIALSLHTPNLSFINIDHKGK